MEQCRSSQSYTPVGRMGGGRQGEGGGRFIGVLRYVLCYYVLSDVCCAIMRCCVQIIRLVGEVFSSPDKLAVCFASPSSSSSGGGEDDGRMEVQHAQEEESEEKESSSTATTTALDTGACLHSRYALL